MPLPSRTGNRFYYALGDDGAEATRSQSRPSSYWHKQLISRGIYAVQRRKATPADVKRDIGTASILKDGRVVFNIGANKYRVVVWINTTYRVVYIRFIGTHKQYDRIDAQTI